MILSAFTLFHVVLSLVGIGAGLVVVCGLLTSKPLEGWTTLFLITTVATNVTGFLFPFHGFKPSHGVGILSLILLAIAIFARRARRFEGAWGRTYAVSAVLALYFNVFVLIVQLFLKVPSLKELAPTQSEPPFQVTQLAVLVLFVALTVLAAVRFRSRPVRAS